MFGKDKKRFETRGIHDRLDIRYRILLWDKLDILSEKMEMDYLQVFEFSVEMNEENQKIQKIVHSQEEPEYIEEYTFPVTDLGVNGKVYVIDDGDHCTMLWAEEY